MTTRNTYTENEMGTASGISQWLIRITILIFFVILNICFLSAQNYYHRPLRVGVGTDAFSSGNGHGAFYSPYLSVGKGRNAFTFGPMIQARKGNTNGGRITYSRNLSGNCETFVKDNYYNRSEILQINVFTYLQYNHQAYLSECLIEEEKMIVRDANLNLDEKKFSTLESGAGIELRVNITDDLCWKNYICASAYAHNNYIPGLDHEQCALSLTLGTGLKFIIN